MFTTPVVAAVNNRSLIITGSIAANQIASNDRRHGTNSNMLIRTGPLTGTLNPYWIINNTSTTTCQQTTASSPMLVGIDYAHNHYNGSVIISTATTTTTPTGGLVYLSNNILYNELPAAKQIRKDHKPVRSAIKKALKLITGIGYTEEVSMFLGGNEVEISHHDSELKFIITRHTNSLISGTERPTRMAPFKIELYTKTNVYISSLCVYFEDTPVLDQLLALMMFIKSGAEDEVLEKANFLKINNDKLVREFLRNEYPQISKKIR